MQIEFDDAYPSLVGLSTTGWELDREFLVELNKTAWDSVVTAFRKDLPDPVIEDAVRKLPPPYYKILGEALTKALKSRRDALPEFARRYYALITREAEIQATDKDEYAHCEHLPSGDLLVRIGLMEGSNGARKTPYFQRTFHPQETRSLRVIPSTPGWRSIVSSPLSPTPEPSADCCSISTRGSASNTPASK